MTEGKLEATLDYLVEGNEKQNLELAKINKEMTAMRIEIERWKTSVNVVRGLSLAVFGVLGFFLQREVTTFDLANDNQNNRIQAVEQSVAIIHDNILKLQLREIK